MLRSTWRIFTRLIVDQTRFGYVMRGIRWARRGGVVCQALIYHGRGWPSSVLTHGSFESNDNHVGVFSSRTDWAPMLSARSLQEAGAKSRRNPSFQEAKAVRKAPASLRFAVACLDEQGIRLHKGKRNGQRRSSTVCHWPTTVLPAWKMCLTTQAFSSLVSQAA